MFWLKFCLIAVVGFLLSLFVKFLLKKILKLENVRKKFFSYNHINELHRKVDMRVRTISAIFLSILALFAIYYSEGFALLYLIGVIIILFVDFTVRVFFEVKYSEYPKQAILSLADMVVILTVIIVMFYSQLFDSY